MKNKNTKNIFKIILVYSLFGIDFCSGVNRIENHSLPINPNPEIIVVPIAEMPQNPDPTYFNQENAEILELEIMQANANRLNNNNQAIQENCRIRCSRYRERFLDLLEITFPIWSSTIMIAGIIIYSFS